MIALIEYHGTINTIFYIENSLMTYQDKYSNSIVANECIFLRLPIDMITNINEALVYFLVYFQTYLYVLTNYYAVMYQDQLLY